MTKAIEQRQFKRSFKHDVVVLPAEEMVDHIRRQLFGKIIGLIGLANKAGVITGGGDMVTEAVKSKRKPALVLIATDVSEAIGQKLSHVAEAQHVQCRVVATKDDFGAILGKAPRSALAVASGGFVAQLVKAIDRYRNFLGEV